MPSPGEQPVSRSDNELPDFGVHLKRTQENVKEIDALAGLLGGRVGLGVLADLNRQARRTWTVGRSVTRAYTWDARDQRSRQWWPQGITTSADAAGLSGAALSTTCREAHDRRLLIVSWYAKDIVRGEQSDNHGSRLTILDLDSLRYRHVLLVVPKFEGGRLVLSPLKVHAGGVVWCGQYLHVAATSRGFFTCRIDDLMRIPDDIGGSDLDRLGVKGREVASYGYRYVLPVRFGYRAYAAKGHPKLRYSFMSLDRSADTPALVVGEYGRKKQTTRLARYPLDPDTDLLATGDDGTSRPVHLEDGGVQGMQGACVAEGRYHLSVMPYSPMGSLYVGQPGSLRRHRWAIPPGPEDLAYWPDTDTHPSQLWTVTEFPHLRWVIAMDRRQFD